MSIGEKLLNLTIEYAAAVEARDMYAELPGVPRERTPAVIAAEYEAALRKL